MVDYLINRYFFFRLRQTFHIIANSVLLLVDV